MAMEAFWALQLTLACIAALAYVLIRTHHKHKPPPGPKPWPIIGNLNLIGSIPHQSFHSLSKQFGPIMHLKFGKFPVVVASTPEMAKQFLKIHDTVFASRPELISGKYTNYNYLGLGWAPYGPYWRQTRKIYLSEMFSAKKMESESFERIRAEERHDFISRLHSLSRKPIFLRDHLFHYAWSTISRMVLGRKYFTETEGDESIAGLDEIHEMMSEWFFLNGVFNIGDWIPWLGFFDLQGYVKRMKILQKKLDKIYEFVIDDHLKRAETKGADASEDVVDKLLRLAEDFDLDVKLTRDWVKALIQNLIVGGADTTPAAVEWIFHELMRHPCIYQKAKDELNTVIGRNRWVEENDYVRLPYVEAVIMETMRLHPVATLLAPHYSSEDCRVAGFDIPKGTTVFINTWSIGRDPYHWEAPEEFLPERFIGKQIDFVGKNFAFMPFGSGRRMCPGYHLGLKVVRTIVANLLHGFDLKLSDGTQPKDVCLEERYGLTTKPKEALALIFEPALPSYLY